MRRKRGWVAIAACVTVAGCAAVTGLGDYEIVDAVLDSGLDGSAPAASPDATSSPSDAGPAPDASHAADAADADAGADAGVDAAGFRGNCLGSPRCPDGGDPAACTYEGCVNAGPTWSASVDAPGGVQRQNTNCVFSAPTPTSEGSVSASLPGAPRYFFELRTYARLESQSGGAEIARLAAGSTVITVEVAGASSVKLCVGGSCTASFSEPAFANGSNAAARIVVFGYWGDTVTGGFVGIALGDADTCSARTTVPLPTPSQGALQARFGCPAGPCGIRVASVALFVTPF